MHPQLSQLIEDFSIEVYVVDADTLQFLYVNSAAEKNLGFTLEELRTHTLDLIAPHSSIAELKQHMASLRSKDGPEELVLGNTVTRRDGTRYVVDVQIRFMEFEGRPAFIGLAQDASEKQLALDQLQSVLKGASLGFWDWNFATDTYHVDDIWLAMLGYARGEIDISFANARQMIAAQDIERVSSALQQFMQSDDNFSIEFRSTHKDGHLVWLRSSGAVVSRDPASGKPLRVSGTHQDITREKLDQLEKEEFLKFFNMSTDLMMIGKLDGTLTRVNPATVQVMGYTEAELLAMPVSAWIHPEDRELSEREVEQQEQSGQTMDFENRCVCKDGSIRWLSWRASFNHEDQLSYASARDITVQKAAEEELRKMHKLNSIGILAGGIAHDFNNILTVLFGNIAIAKSRIPEDHKSYQSLEQAEKAFHRATHLTSQLLTFAKGGDPVKQDISIASFIAEVVQFDLSGSKVKLVFEAPPTLWLAHVDKGQISQVFSNLATNAHQAMPRGGHLYINIHNALVPANSVPGLVPGNYLKFIVRDEGSGIEAANIDKIFDPYFTTKQEGSGLGLATVYSIITKHGGHISVHSTPGTGTTFTIYLPASDKSTASQAPTLAPLTQPGPTPARILVMDDEEMICQLCTTVLTAKGYQVVTTKDGREAITLYKEALAAGTPFDCLLMDLTIPGGMSGKEALVEILKLHPTALAIVSSGYAADPVMANYQSHGFKGCITKPFFIATLVEEIRRVLG